MEREDERLEREADVGLDPRIDNYAWERIFWFADGFTRDDVAEIIAIENDESFGSDWQAVFRLYDGQFAFLTAGCDYTTGWAGPASGHSAVADTLEELIRFDLDEDARQNLGLSLTGI